MFIFHELVDSSGKADVTMSFNSGAHQGHAAFTPLEVAHAWPGGDVHFNSDQQWSNLNHNVSGKRWTPGLAGMQGEPRLSRNL